MTAKELIEKEIKTRCERLGIEAFIIHDVTTKATSKYTEHRFKGAPSKLIDEAVTDAKKLMPKKKGR